MRSRGTLREAHLTGTRHSTSGCEHETPHLLPISSASLRILPQENGNHAWLLCHLLGVFARRGSCSRSQQSPHAVHTHLLANTRWVSTGRHVFDHANLRRIPLVLISSRRYLQIRWRSVRAQTYAYRFFKQHDRQHPCRPHRWALGGSG